MLLIVDKKNISFLKEFGDGEKDGVVELWLSKEQEELEELLMDIVIDFILLLFLPIWWKNILLHKLSKFHLKISSYR